MMPLLASLAPQTIQSASAAIKAYECAMSYSDSSEQQDMSTKSVSRLSAYWRANASAFPDMEAVGERLDELCKAQVAVQKAAAAVSATILYNTVGGHTCVFWGGGGVRECGGMAAFFCMFLYCWHSLPIG